MRLTRVLVVALLGAFLPVLPLTAARGEEGGLIRLAHLSPDTPAVDVYVDSVASPGTGQAFPGVGYGVVSEYQEVPPGTYSISVRSAGEDAAGPPVLSTTVQVAAGQAWTVAGVGSFADLGLQVLEDDLTPPPTGRARMRVIAAAATAETVHVALADGFPVASGLAFADAGEYVDVPAGSTSLRVTPAGGRPTELPVEVRAGAVYSVLVLDGPEGLVVRPALDAASPGVVPAGGVGAGAGGTAGGPAGGPALPVVVTAAAVSVAAGGALFLAASRAVRRSPAGRHAPGS